jgi:DNA-binding response OmpR family regulator
MGKVLVVDDDPDILEAISLILDLSGYEYRAVSDGTRVYKKAKEFCPDVVLLDVSLSGVDGRDVASHLKKSPATKNIPVIMVSAHPSAKNTIRDYGADDFIAKPLFKTFFLKDLKLKALAISSKINPTKAAVLATSVGYPKKFLNIV